MYQHRRIGISLFQIEHALGFEFLVHDAGAVPQQHIGAAFAAHVIA